MKDLPNYGFPLFSIIKLMLLTFLMILLLLLLYFLDIPLLLMIFISFITLPINFFISLVYFKKCFNKKRQSILNKIIQISNLRGNEIILDLGAGAGFLTIGFAKHLNNGKVYGIDRYTFNNNNMMTKIFDIIKINFFGNTLNNAKKNAKIEKVDYLCKFKIADFTKPLNYPDNFFDIISSCQSLYCLPPQKRQSAFKEINRTLKKGGKIIFFEPKSLSLINYRWDLNYVKEYFENISYNMQILQTPEFKKRYIFYGQKK